jgi:thiamine monophosphate synthase
LDLDGNIITRSFANIAELAKLSPIPVVVGGGVKLADIPQLAKTGIDGFFVVSAVTGANDPKLEAIKLVESWRSNRPRKR